MDLSASALYSMLGQFAEDVLTALREAAVTLDPENPEALVPERVLVQPYGTIADDIGEDCSQLAVALDTLFLSLIHI